MQQIDSLLTPLHRWLSIYTEIKVGVKQRNQTLVHNLDVFNVYSAGSKNGVAFPEIEHKTFNKSTPKDIQIERNYRNKEGWVF